MSNILKPGRLVKIIGGPKQFIKKVGLIVFYDRTHEDVFAYGQDSNALCYKVLSGEEYEWFSREELEEI